MKRQSIFIPLIDKIKQHKSNIIFLLPLCFLFIGIVIPVKELFIKGITDNSGQYIGTANFERYFTDSGLSAALFNSIMISLLVALITTLLAFLIAFGATQTQFKGKKTLLALVQTPLFVPSIFPCLGLIYLCGGQGLLTPYLTDFELYGPIGITLGGIIFTLPHATLLLVTTLRGIDPRLHQAASCLGASPWRQFTSVTLANSIYGVISTLFVVFTLTMTDFGIAKVLGGQYPMLATEIYKQVIGQQNFSMGATISLVLIIPTTIAFIIDAWARKKQSRFANNQRYQAPKADPTRDLIFTGINWLIAILLCLVIGVVVWGSLVSYWPYDFSLSLMNYDFAAFGYGWQPYWNSLLLAFMVGTCGVCIVFISSYLSYRTQIAKPLNLLFRFLALLPLGVPGTVLGLAYIFAFNKPDSLLHGLQDTFWILAINTIIHLFSVSFLSISAGLNKLDNNYEKVGNTLGVSHTITFFKVIVPLSSHTLLDVFFYLFVNALTTVSAVVFLYGPKTLLASVTILNMDDSGALASASAMGTLLLLTSLVMKLIHNIINKRLMA